MAKAPDPNSVNFEGIGAPRFQLWIRFGLEDTWIYFERTITRGKLIKLGQNVLKENNVLALEFDRYGVLENKKIYNMNDMKKVTYSAKETDNDISQQSFVGKFLSSIRQKMYGKRKF